MARLAYHKKQEKICFICEAEKTYGITIGSQFMCEECEKSVVATDTNDAKYLFYLNRLEKLKAVLPRHS
ncbi:sigma factor G inhibitor Gin [Pueribacillus sp. YX66]|uniref:sigma factor G inhibitor Gin n=1 Tax=Pueribacillus sp. YX66 TaxID=3229242 RepID=UPI00358D1AA2